MANGSSVFAAKFWPRRSLVNTGAPWPRPVEAGQLVRVMQTNPDRMGNA